MWTILYNGTEKLFPKQLPGGGTGWGICADFTAEFVNKGRDVVRLRTVEEFDAAEPQWAYGEQIVIWRDRTETEGGGFEGGTIFFQGYVAQIRRTNNGGRQGIVYDIYGPWWLMEALKFKQGRNVFDHWTTPGDPSSGAVLTTIYTTEVYFGEKLDGTFQTNGQQVTEILNWANECCNPTRRGAVGGQDASQDILQIGTIDPAVNIPRSRQNDVFCTEAIIAVLRFSPDVVCWFDYSAVDESGNPAPPIFHAMAMGNLAEVTVNITAEQERDIEVAPQYDRRLVGVWINYKTTAEVNGMVWPKWYVEKADAGGWGLYHAGPGGARIAGPGGDTITQYTPWVSDHTIELSGSQVSRISVPVTVLSMAGAVSGDAATRKAWWLALAVPLNEPNIDPASIAVEIASVKDSLGADVNLSLYPNMLWQGQVADWMGVRFGEATVTANVSFTRYRDTERKIKNAEVEQQQLSMRRWLTNAVTKTYRAVTHSDPGEDVPVGAAKAVFDSVKTLQYAGKTTFMGAALKTGIGLGKRLKLVGPTNTYTNILVQNVKAEPVAGRLDVTYGPTAPLDAPARIELARISRYRLVYNMPSGRSSGEATGSADVVLGAANAKDSLHQGQATYKYQATTFKQVP